MPTRQTNLEFRKLTVKINEHFLMQMKTTILVFRDLKIVLPTSSL